MCAGGAADFPLSRLSHNHWDVSMTQRILKAIRIGKTVYVAGMERQFLSEGLSENQLLDMEARGLIIGFTQPDDVAKVAPTVPPEELTALDIGISRLEDFLAGVNDPALIAQWAGDDLRKSARGIYERALERLDAAQEHNAQLAETVAKRKAERVAKKSGPKKKAARKMPLEPEDI